MRTYRDAKAMAKTLRAELAAREIDLSHGECLDIVARQFGLENWNVLSARLNGAPASQDGPALALPEGWFVAGSKPELYEAGIDTTLRRHSGHPALIRCRFTPDDLADLRLDAGFGTLMQSIDAKPFRGHRVRLQAELRTEAAVGSATMWLRVDGRSRQSLAFDNMEERPLDGRLVGTHDWTERRIVLDVPDEAESMHFGFYLRGSGKVWASGFDLQISDSEQATPHQRGFLPNPTNLDFAKSRRAA